MRTSSRNLSETCGHKLDPNSQHGRLRARLRGKTYGTWPAGNPLHKRTTLLLFFNGRLCKGQTKRQKPPATKVPQLLGLQVRSYLVSYVFSRQPINCDPITFTRLRLLRPKSRSQVSFHLLRAPLWTEPGLSLSVSFASRDLARPERSNVSRDFEMGTAPLSARSSPLSEASEAMIVCKEPERLKECLGTIRSVWAGEAGWMCFHMCDMETRGRRLTVFWLVKQDGCANAVCKNGLLRVRVALKL